MAISRVKTWVSGEVLTAADLNSEFNNIIDNALSLISPLTGQLLFTAGSVSAPGLGVSGDTNTGVWSSAADELAFSAGGRQQLTVKGANAGVQAGTYFVPIGLATGETPRQNALFAQSTCKAWAHFDQTGTPKVINSFGVSSISDFGTGQFNVLFARNFDTTAYVAFGTAGTAGGTSIVAENNSGEKGVGEWPGRTTTDAGVLDDVATVYLAFFGLQAGG